MHVYSIYRPSWRCFYTDHTKVGSVAYSLAHPNPWRGLVPGSEVPRTWHRSTTLSNSAFSKPSRCVRTRMPLSTPRIYCSAQRRPWKTVCVRLMLSCFQMAAWSNVLSESATLLKDSPPFEPLGHLEARRHQPYAGRRSGSRLRTLVGLFLAYSKRSLITHGAVVVDLLYVFSSRVWHSLPEESEASCLNG